MSAWYEMLVDKEIIIHDQPYNISFDIKVEYAGEEGNVISLQIKDGEIAPEEGEPFPWTTTGNPIEAIQIENHPDLAEAIDGVMWATIDQYTEDHYADIASDIEESRHDKDL